MGLVRDIHNRIVTEFCEEVEAKAVLDTTGPPAPLGSVALGNVCFDQAAHLPFLIKPHLAVLA